MSFELIFTFLYVGGSIQYTSEQRVWCFNFYFVNFVHYSTTQTKTYLG